MSARQLKQILVIDNGEIKGRYNVEETFMKANVAMSYDTYIELCEEIGKMKRLTREEYENLYGRKNR